MAMELAFDRARIVLFDPLYMNRQTTLGALQTLGFSSIEPVGRYEDFIAHVGQKDYDLLIAETHGHEGRVCDLVHAIRHGRVGQNPFAALLLTTWSLTQDTLNLVINSGADDLLARPFTIAQLRQRITAAYSARKPFVVTCDYVGPARRKARREGDEISTFDVPNTLAARLHPQAEEIGRDEIEAAWRRVLLWKAYRFAERMAMLARSLDPLALSAEAGLSSIRLVESVSKLAAELKAAAQHMGEAEFEAIAAYCDVIENLALKGETRAAFKSESLRLIAEIADTVLARLAQLRPVAGQPVDSILVE